MGKLRDSQSCGVGSDAISGSADALCGYAMTGQLSCGQTSVGPSDCALIGEKPIVIIHLRRFLALQRESASSVAAEGQRICAVWLFGRLYLCDA